MYSIRSFCNCRLQEQSVIILLGQQMRPSAVRMR
nr:MAG TPA: hypothetical protein [Caudoviricetes sp.]